MARPSYRLVMLVNEEEDTPTKYIVKRPNRGQKSADKLRLRKYDQALQRHCWFSEKRLPNPKAK